MTKQAASWRLERGITLGHLEQLNGSFTLFGTLTTQALLLAFNFLGLALLLLWALSPVGGLASSGIITTAFRPVPSNTTPNYLNTSQSSIFDSGADYEDLLPTLNSLYMSSLMAPQTVKNSTMDLWDNIKIPYLSRLAPNSTQNSTGWRKVPDGSVYYSSLLRIPLANLPKLGNATFAMETSYFDFDCFNISYADPISIGSTPSDQGTVDLPPTIAVAPSGTYFGSNGSDACLEDDCLLSFSLALNEYVKDWQYGSP